MAFPEFERVLYARDPLTEVVCQLRFPPILRIEAELPAAFQDRIRGQYPEYSLAEPPVFDVQNIPAPLRPMIEGVLGRRGPGDRVTHQFSSIDGYWTVALARDFVALTTSRYERWEQFRGRLATILTAIEGEYAPAAYLRVGLRYKDLVTRSSLGLGGRPWATLLAPQIAAELADPAIDEDSVDLARRQIRFEAMPGMSVVIQHGLMQTDERADRGELSYFVDMDLFSEERNDAERALPTLDVAHDLAWRIWRWCIQQELHEALEPRPVG